MRSINELIQMKKSLYWLLKIINYLEITTLTTVAVIMSMETVMAKPLCYLVDANGRRVDLNYLCATQKKISQPPIQAETPPAQSDFTPETVPNSSSSVENQTEATNNNNQQPIQPESTGEEKNTGEEEIIDTSKVDPAQKTIPLQEEK